MRTMMPGHGQLLAVLLAGSAAGCGDNRTVTTPGDLTGDTGPGASETTASGTGDSTDSTGTGTMTDAGTTSDEDALAPWYGAWYSKDPQFPLNTPVDYANGGASFGFGMFDLRAGGATLRSEFCLWGSSQYEYTTMMGDDGFVVLEPVGGTHEFNPGGKIDRLYIVPGADCTSLFVRAVSKEGEESDVFSWYGEPLARGELCLKQCAEDQSEFGVISDCGTPVPWACGE